MTTYGYVRVSTVEQANGTSLDEQERRIQGVALMRGEQLVQVFSDAGVSGSVPLQSRPAGKALLATLKPGDVVVAAKLDRVFRSARDALNQSDAFKAQGVKLVLADMGSESVTTNGVSALFFNILACVADFERERIRERIGEGKKAKAAKSGFLGGGRTFGYRVEGEGKESRLVPDALEQKALKDMKRLRAKGLSFRLIAQEVKAKHGIQVSHVTVQAALGRGDKDKKPGT